jgi:GH15 family glucan-1,4-alpha-glucosidase
MEVSFRHDEITAPRHPLVSITAQTATPGGAAPGAPGITPTWSSSAKEMVGCSLGMSRLWFTIGGGIVNEVYYPRVDIPQIRDLGFLVADGRGFWVEVKRLWQHTVELLEPGIPAVRVVHRHERFELTLRVVPCVERDALLIDVVLRRLGAVVRQLANSGGISARPTGEDETALPVVLAAFLAERGALGGTEIADMVLRALSFIVGNGPASDQDRWEESAGLNTFTLAACVAALVAGAPHLPADARELALVFADYWNSRLEDWTAVYDTPIARQFGIPGYYVRVAPAQVTNDRGAFNRVLPIKNQALDPDLPAAAQFGVDFLQLVRFGLRRCDDPLIVGSVRLADALLKVDTPYGPAWRRYYDDGYGEHDDGSPYDGIGRGRPWPFLTGERGHYEVACGNDPLPLMETMVKMASLGGMLPEQVWDAAPILRRGLSLGRRSLRRCAHRPSCASDSTVGGTSRNSRLRRTVSACMS